METQQYIPLLLLLLLALALILLQQYKSAQCYHTNATMGSLCTVVELQKYYVLLFTISIKYYEFMSSLLP